MVKGSPFEAFLRLCLSTNRRRYAFRSLIQALFWTLSLVSHFHLAQWKDYMMVETLVEHDVFRDCLM